MLLHTVFRSVVLSRSLAADHLITKAHLGIRSEMSQIEDLQRSRILACVEALRCARHARNDDVPCQIEELSDFKSEKETQLVKPFCHPDNGTE
ncbi:hypothetical protein B296_00038515 [Ensete ventricosum]|uniref:Uncharacterized protein n=1 Tax=Ensete ventricosum TaxID=4639 RepID=A0A426ZW66_ENSVE|nr:hypothetical protein B296_00038515 [Ensete ventricosum]